MRRGTTLLELVVVLSIVAVFAHMAVLYAGRKPGGPEHLLTCYQFMTELSYAQQLSRSGQRVRLIAVPGFESYYAVFANEKLLKKVKLPSGVYFDEFDELVYIQGHSYTGKTFRISNQNHAVALVVVAMSTDRIRLEQVRL